MTEPTRESIIAAAEAAMAEHDAPKADPEPTPVVEQTPAAETTPAQEPETKLSQVIRAKKQAHQIKAEAERERVALAKERSELERLRASIKENPLAALKELGLDVNTINQQVINEGTPEAEVAKVRKEIEQERAERERLQASLAQREAKAAEEAFVTVASKHPTLSALYGDEPQELISKAYAVQKAYYDKTGEIPTREEIAEYLESVESRRYARLAKAAPAAQQSKTISPSRASESATPQKPFEKMTPSEQRRHLIRVAQEAEKNYKPTPVGW